MKVSIYSREEIEKIIDTDFPKNSAVISFYDPKGIRSDNLTPVDYKNKAEMIYQVAVYDIDIECLEDYGLTFDTYLPEAKEIAKFIYKAKEKGFDIICQCQYGQSRSAGCAAAILEHFENNGISIFANYNYYPNQVVFNKMLKALDEVKDERN